MIEEFRLLVGPKTQTFTYGLFESYITRLSTTSIYYCVSYDGHIISEEILIGIENSFSFYLMLLEWLTYGINPNQTVEENVKFIMNKMLEYRISHSNR